MKQIVISLSDKLFKDLKEGTMTNDQILDLYRIARNEGVVLPEKHGKLIDIGKIKYTRTYDMGDNPIEIIKRGTIESAKTIIKATEE